MLLEDCKFCPCCNYILSEEVIVWAAFDFPCPACEVGGIRNFYSYGSSTHKEKWESYLSMLRGEFSYPAYYRNPVSFPTPLEIIHNEE